VLEPASHDITIGLASVATARMALGEHAAARGLLERMLGRCAHSTMPALCSSQALNGLGALDRTAGDLDGAWTRYDRSRTLCQEHSRVDNPDCAFALVGLGEVALARGRFEEALPLLEQAAALGTRAHTTPGEYGEIRFALARALRAAKREPERARALAEEAMAAYRKLGPLRREPAEIAAWLQRDG
jgi:tetratricopeptide (TPR) repeat protein